MPETANDSGILFNNLYFPKPQEHQQTNQLTKLTMPPMDTLR